MFPLHYFGRFEAIPSSFKKVNTQIHSQGLSSSSPLSLAQGGWGRLDTQENLPQNSTETREIHGRVEVSCFSLMNFVSIFRTVISDRYSHTTSFIYAV